jgi:hypothetical protein
MEHPHYGAPSLNSTKTLSRCLLTENVEANKSVHCLIPKMALLDFPIAIYLSHGTTHSYPNSPPTISKCRTVNELSSTTSAYILSSKPWHVTDLQLPFLKLQCHHSWLLSAVSPHWKQTCGRRCHCCLTIDDPHQRSRPAPWSKGSGKLGTRKPETYHPDIIIVVTLTQVRSGTNGSTA